jgi:thiamine kinase-like enzyme
MAVVAQMAARLWPGRVKAIEPLARGITNANYRIELEGEVVVLRVPGANTSELGIDRHHELEAGRLAASVGVGPEVVLVDEASGCLVTRYIEGRPVEPDELRAEPMLGELGRLLRAVHAAGTVPAVFDPYTVVRTYHDTATRRDVGEPFDFATLCRIMERIERARPFRPTAFGHNDLLNANFIHDGSLRIVDWEYAGMSDPFFDLANVSVNHGFGPEADSALIGHYCGRVDDGLVATLRLMKLVSELREAMWGVVQLAISDLDVDFHAYAAERGASVESLAASFELEDMLALAARAASRP